MYFSHKKYADYFAHHDCKIVMFNCGQIFGFMENFGIERAGKLSRVTWNHWLSLDDVYSHKRCPSETYVYMVYKEYVSPFDMTGV